MRCFICFITLLAWLLPGLSAGEKEAKQDHAEFSRLLHKVIVAQLPKEVEDESHWGQTIPAPPKLPLSQLRKFIKVGDKLEVPHGAWRKFKGKIENPNKDLKIVVKEFKNLDDKTYRLVADVDVTFLCQAQWQQWQKGLLLIDTAGAADANVTAAIVCDIGVELNLNKFPPELSIDPKVTDLGLNLVDLKVRKLTSDDKPAKDIVLGDELKKGLRTLLKTSEPTLKTYINRAIAQSLRDGKGSISAAAMMEALPTPKKK